MPRWALQIFYAAMGVAAYNMFFANILATITGGMGGSLPPANGGGNGNGDFNGEF